MQKLIYFLISVCLSLSIFAQNETKSLWGFNSKWSYMPPVKGKNYKKFIANVKKLQPQILRYPGGTITHHWNWQKGMIEKKQKGVFHNPIKNLTHLVKETNIEVLFVLDIVNRSLEDQIAMLKASKVPVKYVEIGNEIYDGNYKEELPTGADYAKRVNAWLPTLRKEFPKAKFSVSLLGRDPSGKRLKKWNKLIINNLKDIDAYTYHVYVKTAKVKTVKERIAEYERNSAITKDSGKEIWITEYGVQNEEKLSKSGKKIFINQLDELRQYIEANSQISMCHILTTHNSQPKSSNFSAIEYGGKKLNFVGEYFLKKKK